MTLIVTTETQLSRVAPPALPFATPVYSSGYQDQLNNILRLYFNRLSATLNQLTTADTIAGLVSPHISAASTVTQYATGNDTPTLVLFNTLVTSEGFTLNMSGSATCVYAGVYSINYGLQLTNNDNDIHFVTVWLRVNGVDAPLTAVKFTLPARKNASEPYELLGVSRSTFSVNAGDEVELWWATELAATSGGVSGVYLKAEPAQTTPFPHPTVPSAFGDIQFVSALP